MYYFIQTTKLHCENRQEDSKTFQVPTYLFSPSYKIGNILYKYLANRYSKMVS